MHAKLDEFYCIFAILIAFTFLVEPSFEIEFVLDVFLVWRELYTATIPTEALAPPDTLAYV